MKPAASLSFFFVSLFCASIALGLGLGSGTSYVAFDTGDTSTPYSALVGTTTAVAIYTSTPAYIPRKIRVCNPHAFDLYVATFSVFNSSSPATLIPQRFCDDIWTGYSSWALFDPAAGGTTRRIFGWVEWDSRD